MKTEGFYPSRGEGNIHFCRWTPDGEIRAVVQIVHGIAEYGARYEEFANYLNSQGILVVAEDHMGHGGSLTQDTTRGYFAGGWFTAVEDTCQLMATTRAEFPELPYVLFGHSMGSFMTRTILARYPGSGISGAVICGTGWMDTAVLKAGQLLSGAICRLSGARKPSELLQGMVFGGYNSRVEHPRTAFDWLNRDEKQVDAYIADPLCGFTASAGLLRDMMNGILYVQKAKNLQAMNKALPVFFIAGGNDPVGNYGKGVRQAAQAFQKAGMQTVSQRIYPLCRHEILNEINRQEVYADVVGWLREKVY